MVRDKFGRDEGGSSGECGGGRAHEGELLHARGRHDRPPARGGDRIPPATRPRCANAAAAEGGRGRHAGQPVGTGEPAGPRQHVVMVAARA